jgi:hypothetical protein
VRLVRVEEVPDEEVSANGYARRDDPREDEMLGLDDPADD